MELKNLLNAVKKIGDDIKKQRNTPSIIASNYHNFYDDSTLKVYVKLIGPNNEHYIYYELSGNAAIHFIDEGKHIIATDLRIEAYIDTGDFYVGCRYYELQNDVCFIDTHELQDSRGTGTYFYYNTQDKDTDKNENNETVKDFIEYSKGIHHAYLLGNFIRALHDSNNYNPEKKSYDYHTSYDDNKLTIYFNQDFDAYKIDEYRYYHITRFSISTDKDFKFLSINFILNDYKSHIKNVNIDGINMDKLKENDIEIHTFILDLIDEIKEDVTSKAELEQFFHIIFSITE